MTNPKITLIWFRILFVLLIVACFAAPLAADPLPEGEAPERTGSEAAPADGGVSGMRVIVDPAMGKIVSNQAHESRLLSRALEHALNRSTEDLEVFDIPSGGFGVHLQGRFQNVMTVKVKGDGSLEVECVDNARRAREVLHPDAADSDDSSGAR